MKAKLKKTGEIINIAEYDMVKLDKCDSYGNPIEVPYEEVEQFYDDKGVPLGIPIVFPSVVESSFSIDWGQRRYEIAKAAIQGLLSNSTNDDTIENYVNVSVKIADSLIEELKKTM